MTFLLYLVIALVVVAAVYAVLRKPVAEYVRMRGARVITCPENEQPAAVTLDARLAALTFAGGHERLRLDTCSRWPEKAGCGQECLTQIEAQPMDCLVKTQVSRWYADKACAICGKALGFREQHDLGIYKKARLGNTFRWELEEMGYSKKFVETATEGLIVYIARKA